MLKLQCAFSLGKIERASAINQFPSHKSARPVDGNIGGGRKTSEVRKTGDYVHIPPHLFLYEDVLHLVDFLQAPRLVAPPLLERFQLLRVEHVRVEDAVG